MQTSMVGPIRMECRGGDAPTAAAYAPRVAPLPRVAGSTNARSICITIRVSVCSSIRLGTRAAPDIAASGSDGPEGELRLAHADSEIILCGGAINTPQLLKLSGVGPAAQLHACENDVVLGLSGVGANLQDHVVAPFFWLTKNKSGSSQDR